MRLMLSNMQKRALDFTCNNRVMIVAPFGAGKTAVALSFIFELLYNRFENCRILVVSSRYAIENTWRSELAKWDGFSPIDPVFLFGKQKNGLFDDSKNVFIVSYDNVQDICKLKLDPFEVIIIDEIEECCNHRNKRYEVLLALCHKATKVIAFSSEEPGKGLEDKWSQYFLLDFGERLYPHYAQFLERFFLKSRATKGKKCILAPKNSAQEEIWKLVKDITFFSSDLFDCNLNSNYYVEMSSTEFSKFKLLKRLLEQKKETVDSELFRLINGVHTTDCNERIVLHKRKSNAVRNICEENPHSRIVISCWFDTDVDMLNSEIGKGVLLSDPRSIKQWNSTNTRLAYIIVEAEVDTPIAADILIWYSLTWNKQLINRLNSLFIGNHSQTNVIYLVCRRTIEEDIYNYLITEKRN